MRAAVYQQIWQVSEMDKFLEIYNLQTLYHREIEMEID